MEGLSSSDVIIGFSIKALFSLLFIYVFTYYYGGGALYGDSANFYNDAYALSQLAYESPLEYIKLLLGLADEKSAQVWPFVEQTRIWEYVGENEIMNDNRLIIKLNSVVHLLSFGNVYIHLLFHLLLSFIGVLLLFTAFNQFIKRKTIFWYCLLLTPSISFWGGGISKESLMILALGLFFYGLIKITTKKQLIGFLFYVLGIAILLLNKPYVGLILVPFSFVYILGHLLNYKSKYITFASVLIGGVFLFLVFVPTKVRLTERISFKQQELINMAEGGIIFMNDSAFCKFDYSYSENFIKTNDTLIKVVETTDGEYKLYGEKVYHSFSQPSSDKEYRHYLSLRPSTSYYQTTPISNSGGQLIKNAPSALLNVLIRPFPWDNGDGLKVFSFIQNIGLLLLLGLSIIKMRKFLNQEKWMLFMLVLSALFLTLLVGWTTPIFGAAVRYKVPVDLFLIIVSFILLKTKNYAKV